MSLCRPPKLVWRLFAVVALGFLFARPASAMSVRPPAFSELVDKADAIVHVTVESVRAQWDTTPTGDRVIHTYVTCGVHETIKGTPTQQIELRFLGGSVGHERLVVSDMPRYAVGEEYVLFVAGNGKAFCPLVHVMHGSYPVAFDSATGERRIQRHGGEPLKNVAEVSQPFATTTASPIRDGMTLAQFRGAIAAQLNAGGVSHAR